MQVLLGVALFFLGQTFGWFQLNLQKFSPWWENKPIFSAVFLGVPTSIAFWYAWKHVSEATGSVWSARFMGSSIGFIIFPLLTWYILGESMFTAKTLVCLALSILILVIQIFC